MAFAVCSKCLKTYGIAEVSFLSRECPLCDGRLDWEDLEENIDDEDQSDSDNNDGGD